MLTSPFKLWIMLCVGAGILVRAAPTYVVSHDLDRGCNLDVCPSTTLSPSKLAPGDLSETLNEVFREIAHIVEQDNNDVSNTVGPGVDLPSSPVSHDNIGVSGFSSSSDSTHTPSKRAPSMVPFALGLGNNLSGSDNQFLRRGDIGDVLTQVESAVGACAALPAVASGKISLGANCTQAFTHTKSIPSDSNSPDSNPSNSDPPEGTSSEPELDLLSIPLIGLVPPGLDGVPVGSDRSDAFGVHAVTPNIDTGTITAGEVQTTLVHGRGLEGSD